MLKRTIAWMLVLTLVMSVMPQLSLGVTAEGEQVIPAAHSHSATQHNCEHCEETITWQAWDKTDSLPTDSGHYYLTADVKPTAQAKLTGTTDMVLCLNGYTINGENYNATPLYVQDTAKLTISDCTAYTDAEGVFHAGTFTKCRAGGAMPTAIYAKNNAKVAVYNCIFTDNHSVKGSVVKEGQGGAIQMRGDLAGDAPVLHLENVVFDGNTAVNSVGALSVYGSTTTPVVTVKKCTFKNNSAPTGGAVYLTKANATFEECTIEANSAQYGGAIYAASSTLYMKNCKITGNKVSKDSAGNIQNKTTTAVFEGCTIENNEAVGTAGSAFYIHGGNSKVTLKDTSVINNRHTGTKTAARAGIYVTNKSDKLIVEGKTVVDGNLIATDGDAIERNIFVQTSPNSIDVGGLSDGASISIFTNWGTDETPTFVTAATAPAAWSSTWVTYENADKAVGYDADNDFFFTDIVAPDPDPEPDPDPDPTPDPEPEPESDHKHCQCGATDCTETGHEKVEYVAWDGKDALPPSGNYYLKNDVELAGETSVTGNLNLCLNGHTVKAADGKRHMSTVKDQGVIIAISDCTASTDADGNYTAGKIYGGRDIGGNAGGGAAYIRAGSTLKIFDGIFTDNRSYLQGGAICMADGTTFEMHGGELSDNQAVSTDGKTWKKGGALAVFNCKTTITGGTIKNNKALNGGGIAGYSKSAVTITGGTICSNWSKSDGGGLYVNGAGLYVSGDTKVCHNESTTAGGNLCYGGNSYGSVTGITVEGGKGGGAGAMIQNGANVTMTNVTFKNNETTSTGGAIRLYKATLALTDCTITGNTAKTCGGISAENNAVLTITNGTISDNTATSSVGGIRITGGSSLTLAGKPVISGNAGGNLLLVGGVLMDVSAVTEGAEIWLSADMGPISKPCEDLSKYFKSESVYRGVIYKDGALHMATDGSHKHCFCMGDATGCDHEIVEWVAWESTNSLPASGNYYLLNDVVLADEQSITSDVNICLNGKTVTAADGQRHISTVKGDAAHIVICDCTATTVDGVYTAGKLTGGVHKTTNTGGGSIYLRSGGSVELFDGIICGNTSDLAGGAIAMNSGAAFTMHGGEISGNTAFKTSVDENGAEVVEWKDGGGIFSAPNNDVKILGGTIKNNEGLGGAGLRFSGKGDLLIAGGTITGNVGHGQGGGVFASSTTVTITGGQIIGNKSTSSAGGLCLGTGAIATMTGGEISGNQSTAGGGVIIQGSSTLALSGGKITGNTSTSVGGGIGMYSKAALTMTGGEISGNTSAKNGGGIYCTTGFVDMQAGKISGNTSSKDGAGIYVNAQGNVDISGTALISGNKLTSGSGAGISYGGTSTGKISGGIIEKNAAVTGGGGGLIAQNKATLEITDGIIRNNTAKSTGGGVWAYKSTLTISGGTFEGNKSTNGQGGGIAASSESVFTMTGGTVKNNYAKAAGGGISSNKCTTNISGVTVTGNSCERDGAGIYNTAGVMNIKGGVVSAYNHTKGNGGGFCYGSKSSGYISGISVYGNTVDGGGGGAIIQGGANVTIGYASITGNTAKKTAGGIYVYKANLTMTGGKISGNTAKGSGGAIYAVDSGDMKLSNLTISKNEGKSGGGVYALRTKTFMKDSVISENVSSGSGTGFYSSGGTWKEELAGGEFTNVKFVGNKGGASCSGAAAYINSDVVISFVDCEITDNVSENFGAGIYAASGANPTVINCKFTGNEVAKNGGGFYTGDTGTVINCYFADNKADKGAGIFAGNYIERWHCNGFGDKRDFETGLTITDCTFEGNDAVTDGGGFHLDMSPYTTMDNCTFTGNTAGVSGSAMWLWENCNMTNLTVTGNICANNGHAVVLADSEFDGQTYINGLFKMGGDMIIKDNEGGDLYLDYKTTIGALAQGYGPKTHMNVTLDEGLLTQRVDGYYNYEGGNLVYTLTYGERSMTDPEYDPNLVAKPAATQQNQKNQTAKTDILLYVGIGVIGLAAIAGAVLVIAKKKKSASAETK